MKSIINILLVCVLALMTMQCEVVSDKLLTDPNNPSPDNVSADFLLNSIEVGEVGTNGEVGLPDEFDRLQGDGGALTRMYQFSGATYESAYSGTSFDSDWTGAYSSILENVKTLIPLANKKQLYSHAGIARVIRAYLVTNLVDKFGPVPLSEALDADNFNPDVDSGPDVYAYAMAQLDSAIIDFKKDELALPANDIYYGDSNDPDASWITLAKTLKLNMLVKTRLVQDNSAAINALIDEGDLIKEADQAFVFPYSKNDSNPDSRSSEFADNYTSTGTTLGAYMPDYFMNLLVNDQSVLDPRIRYYFYRQVNKPPTDTNLQQCIPNPPPSHYTGLTGDGKGMNDPWCEDWNDLGYWGRDHGRNLGIPPDTQLRTIYGVYPYGGRFDADQAEPVDRKQGLQGAGIQPMWMPFYTDFIIAEAQLMINNDPGAARAALEKGVRSSIKYVMDFGSGMNPTGTDAVTSEKDGETFIPSKGVINTFVDGVLADYDASSTKQSKLNMIGKEYYISLWGNGMEAYNLYRRVAPARHAPNWHMQPSVFSDPGTFYRSFPYPANFVERNSTVSQKAGNGVKVFWDNNPDGIFDF